ncbi:MAG: class I SAM-dependent methyltransferase [Pseudomonas fluorescens]
MSTAARSEKNVIELFDDIADAFESFSGTLDSVERPMNRWMVENLPKGRRALDIGCGAGRYSVMLADLYGEVVGADPAPSMIEIAKRDRPRSNVSYQIRDAFDMTPEKDGLFDVVFAFSCVFHMAKPDVILPHLAALVAPRGVLVIFDPERPDDWGQENWRINYAFRVARIVYDVTGEVEMALNAIRVFTHESWLAISERSVPFNRAEFRREYSAVLPDVTFEDNIFPGFLTARWPRPAD